MFGRLTSVNLCFDMCQEVDELIAQGVDVNQQGEETQLKSTFEYFPC